MEIEADTTIPDFLKPGARTVIGEHVFKPEEIISFAKKFDPQLFHLDAEAAEKTMFGALCASGWHTVSVWMKLQRKSVAMHVKRLKSEGKTYPEFGPSPGMKNLKWLHPVYAGDIITYANTTRDLRQSRSRSDWWILQNFSEGANQSGDPVMEFESTVFVKFIEPEL